MVEKIITFKVDIRAEGYLNLLKSPLEGMLSKVADSDDFEDILSKAIMSLYKKQPNGQENYGGENPNLGSVGLCRSNNEIGGGHANIEFNPSLRYRPDPICFVQQTLGVINLRDKSYFLYWGKTIGNYPPSETLIKDTKEVMKCLGLKKKQKE